MIQPIGQMPSDIQNILGNIRQLRDKLDTNGFESHIDSSKGNVESFQDTLAAAVGGVNEDMQTSKSLKTSFELGDPSVSLEQVTIASQKASVGFEAMVQVRNKLIDAYKEVMNMPV